MRLPNSLQLRPCRPKTSTVEPQRQVWLIQRWQPRRRPTAIFNESSSSKVPKQADGIAFSQAPDSRVETARRRAASRSLREALRTFDFERSDKDDDHAFWMWRDDITGQSRFILFVQVFTASARRRSGIVENGNGRMELTSSDTA